MCDTKARRLALFLLFSFIASTPRLFAKAAGANVCSNSPRVIIFDASPSGRPSWENCPNTDLTTPLHQRDSIQVRVEKVNPFRHAVKISTEHTTFTELYTVPSSFDGKLFPSSKPTTEDQKAGNAAKGAAGLGGGGAGGFAIKALVDSLNVFQAAAGVLAEYDTFPSIVQTATLASDDPAQVVRNLREGARLLFKPSDPSVVLSAAEIAAIRTRQESQVDADHADFEVEAGAAPKTIPPEVAGLLAAERARFKIIDSTRDQRDGAFQLAVNFYARAMDRGFGTVVSGPPEAVAGDDEVRITVAFPLTDEAVKFDNSVAKSGGAKTTASTTDSGGGSGSAGQPATTGDSASHPTIVIPVIGGFRPSFSSGIFFSGLTSPSFFKDSNGKARSGSRDSFSTALGALVHTPFPTCSPDVSWAVSLGVALKDSNPIYVLGGSVILGRRQRTVFSAGVAGGQVVHLSGIKLGDAVSGDQVPTAKVFRYSFFFGLSYNFGPTNSNSNSSQSRPSSGGQ